jgi:hypothetical protein
MLHSSIVIFKENDPIETGVILIDWKIV